MFTGIIEAVGTIKQMKSEGTNLHFFIESPISTELKIDQSISHQGVCLTVTNIESNGHWVTAIEETLTKSNLGLLAIGDTLNMERCMVANGRFDGHVVQGHVDQTGRVISIVEKNGSWLIDIEYDPTAGNITVEKGSVCIDGVSLTCFNSRSNNFTVAIIPYTYEHTTLSKLKTGDTVNLEFDIIGKYVQRILGVASK